MGAPERPVVAVLGDGSTLYAIQALWTAARYGVGVLVIVMANGSYAVMDALARDAGGRGAWPPFDEVRDRARSRRRSAARRGASTGHDELIAALDEVLPGLAALASPCSSTWRFDDEPARR